MTKPAIPTYSKANPSLTSTRREKGGNKELGWEGC